MSDSEPEAAAAPSKYVVGTLSPVAVPLASKKLHSKIYKAVKKGVCVAASLLPALCSLFLTSPCRPPAPLASSCVIVQLRAPSACGEA